MVVVTNLPPPSLGVRHLQPSTMAVINNRVLGKGTLYIAESHLSWVNGCSGQGFSLEYPHISIHAVSRDQQAYPEECLYIILDADIDFSGPGHQSGESDDNEDDEGAVTELRFVPEDKTCLDAMFSALSDCQVLHPDSQDSLSEDEGHEDDEDCEEEEFDEFGNPRVGTNTNGDTEMDIDEGQFDDADGPDAD